MKIIQWQKNNDIKNGLHLEKGKEFKSESRIHHTILKYTKTKLRFDRIHSKQCSIFRYTSFHSLDDVESFMLRFM